MHRVLVSLSTAVLLLICLSGCDSLADRVAKHQARGLELAEKGEFAKAQLEFRTAIKLDQTYIAGWLELAKLLERQKKFPEAYSHFLKVLELDRKHVEALIHLAQIALLAGQIDKALEYANTAQTAAPQNAQVLAVKSAVSLRVGNSEAAVAEAQQALAIDPDSTGAAVVLITAQRDSGDLPGALRLTDQYLTLHPQDLALNLSKLQILSIQKDDAAIGAHLGTLTQTFPQVASFHTARAEWLVQQGDIDGAIAEYRSVAATNADDIDATLDVARFLIRVRGLDAGRAELQSQIDAHPGTYEYVEALASLEFSNGKPDVAAKLMQGVIDKGSPPKSVNAARVQLARFKVNERDLAAARALVEQVLKEDARNADALGLRAAILIEQKDLAGAIVDVRAALGESPEDVKLLQLAASAFALDGSIELASESYGKAARVSNFDPTIGLRYADLLMKNNQGTAAAAVLTETARRHPESRDVLTALAEVRLRLRDWTGAEQVAQALREGGGDAVAADRVMAAALTGQERFSESINLLQQMSSGDAGARDSNMAALVSVYVRANQPDQARAFLDSVIADNPGNLQALFLRAALHKYQGELPQAETIYQDILTRAPTVAAAYTGLADHYQSTGRPTEALALIRQGIEKLPNEATLRLTLAQMLELGGDFDAAIAEYQALFNANPDSLVVANNLASLLSDHKADDPASVKLATEAARRLRSSTVPQFKDTYGWTMYLSGDYDQALESLLGAVAALPDNPWVQYHIGMTYAKLQQPEPARSHLENALKLAEGTPFNKLDDLRRTLAGLPTAPVQQ